MWPGNIRNIKQEACVRIWQSFFYDKSEANKTFFLLYKNGQTLSDKMNFLGASPRGIYAKELNN